MTRKQIMALTLAAAGLAAPFAQASQLPQQWFLGKWGCRLDSTPITMTGMAGARSYVFRNMFRGVRIDMDVIKHTPTTVSMQDETGNIFSLRSQIRALGPKMSGTATIDGVASNLICLKTSPLVNPPDVQMRVPTQ